MEPGTIHGNGQSRGAATPPIQVSPDLAVHVHHTGPRCVTVQFDATAAPGPGERIALIDDLFNDPELEVIRWQAPLDDWHSRAHAWNNGFRIDGRWRGRTSDRGSGSDLVIGSLARTEPRSPAHPWWEPIEITGDRSYLREWTEADLARLTVDPAMQQYAAHVLPTFDSPEQWLTTIRHEMASGSAIYWCIADARERAVGGLQVTDLNRPQTLGSGRVAYFLSPKARGAGYLGDSMDLLTYHAFSDRDDFHGRSGLGLHRLVAGTDVTNRPSQRVLRRAGFRQVAAERSVLAQSDGPPTGALTFELLATDDMLEQSVEPGRVPVLRTERLTLRAWELRDVPQHHPADDPLAHLFLSPAALPTVSTFSDWLDQRGIDIDRGTAVVWCIADAVTDQPLGTLGIFDIDLSAPGNAEIGYWMYPPARGHRYLSEALPAAITFGLTPINAGGLGLHRLQAVADQDNVPSRRALERAGFRQWGRDHRSTARSDGQLTDLAHYELLAANTAFG